jgi:hypothetical protein
MADMDSQRFCLWLSELLLDRACALTTEETATIRRRLSDVFLHEIDPMMGDEAHQARLRLIHLRADDVRLRGQP